MKTICISLFVLIFGPIILKAQLPGILDAAKIVNQAMVTYTDEAEFVSIFSSFGYKSPDQIELNRSATTSGFKNVYGFNIPDEKDPIGFKWNKADEETNEWRPQGIAGFQKGNKRFLIVTWYAIDAEKITNVSNNHKGARISIVDITNMNTIRYRHILLVQNIANKSNPE
ncbi:MAG TPA: hypothetical protein PLU53_15335, partial [Bacteroidia bacterium]|nr:hypothetical protein [Bacteroidia bacterium]